MSNIKSVFRVFSINSILGIFSAEYIGYLKISNIYFILFEYLKY